MGRSPFKAAARLCLALFVAAAILVPHSARAQEKQPLLVFAAASLKNALDEINAAWSKQSGVEVRASYAGSNALAKQIESGAPADLFLSADIQWMDHVDKKSLIRAGTRQNLLGNSIVLIAPKDSKTGEVKIDASLNLAGLLGKERLAVANTEAVPAGRYAKAALTHLKLWDSVQRSLAEAENVRAALLFVARGETPLGIVYSTDAAAEAGVRIVGTFPEDSHPPIIYPMGVIAESKNPQAAAYWKHLSSPQARAVFEKHGFRVLAAGSST